MDSNLAAAVGWKEGQNGAIWPSASVQSVCVGFCSAFVCLCVYKSSSTAAENCLVVIQNSLSQFSL